jgi:hypothetical protein
MRTFPDQISLFPGKPDGFVSDSKYCRDEVWLGTLKAPDGSPLNKNSRNKYYPPVPRAHIARTPPHAIRYAISRWTEPGDLVLDPFLGSGTTGVEAILQGRRVTGIELEFPDIAESTLVAIDPSRALWEMLSGDSEELLDRLPDLSVSLVNFSNPYWRLAEGSPSKMQKLPDGTWPKGTRGAVDYLHPKSTKSVTKTEYFRKMAVIQRKSCEKLKPGGHAVFVIKDPMYRYRSSNLHEQLADLLPDSMEHIGTFALPHYPETLAMRSYPIRFNGIRPTKEQICPVFRKKT